MPGAKENPARHRLPSGFLVTQARSIKRAKRGAKRQMRGSLRVHVKPVQHWFHGSGEKAQFLRLGRNLVSTRCPGEGYAGSVRRLCGRGGPRRGFKQG